MAVRAQQSAKQTTTTSNAKAAAQILATQREGALTFDCFLQLLHLRAVALSAHTEKDQSHSTRTDKHKPYGDVGDEGRADDLAHERLETELQHAAATAQRKMRHEMSQCSGKEDQSNEDIAKTAKKHQLQTSETETKQTKDAEPQETQSHDYTQHRKEKMSAARMRDVTKYERTTRSATCKTTQITESNTLTLANTKEAQSHLVDVDLDVHGRGDRARWAERDGD